MLDSLQHRITLTSETPVYTCEICHDNGWIETRDESGYRFVKECVCQKALRAERLMKNSGLEEALRTQTMDSFIAGNEMQRQVKQKASEYLTALFSGSDKKPWFYFGGQPGSGKTHICTAMCGEILKHGVAVRYMQWTNEARSLKAMITDDEYDDEISKYFDVSVLYIDDLLKQKYAENPVFSEADIRLAFTILNARYLRNKPTIISSEWSLIDQLLPADEGVFSRVYERCGRHMINIRRDRGNNFRMRAEAV